MKNEMIKDMQKIRSILTFFDYNDKNLTTADTLNVIKELATRVKTLEDAQ